MSQPTSALRELRTRLGLLQTECASALGVAVETFRTWDAGRRLAPAAILRRAKRLKSARRMTCVHRRILRADKCHDVSLIVGLWQSTRRHVDGLLMSTSFSRSPGKHIPMTTVTPLS